MDVTYYSLSGKTLLDRPIPGTPLLIGFQCQRDNRIEFHSIKLAHIRFSEAFVAAAADSNLPEITSFRASTPS